MDAEPYCVLVSEKLNPPIQTLLGFGKKRFCFSATRENEPWIAL